MSKRSARPSRNPPIPPKGKKRTGMFSTEPNTSISKARTKLFAPVTIKDVDVQSLPLDEARNLCPILKIMPEEDAKKTIEAHEEHPRVVLPLLHSFRGYDWVADK